MTLYRLVFFVEGIFNLPENLFCYVRITVCVPLYYTKASLFFVGFARWCLSLLFIAMEWKHHEAKIIMTKFIILNEGEEMRKIL